MSLITVDPATARQSPLAGRSLPDVANAGLRLAERPHLGKLTLRGSPGEDAGGDRPFLAAAGRELGVLLPTEPATARRVEDVTALWLGPDEWLLVTDPGAEGALKDRLEAAFAGLHASVVDVTHNATTLRLTGHGVRTVLAKGMPMDTHARGLAVGEVRQSVLAHVDVICHVVDETEATGTTVDLFVRRSFADHVWTWLEDAGAEFGVGGGAGA
jgi:sarcosine oxidase subunit gamma